MINIDIYYFFRAQTDEVNVCSAVIKTIKSVHVHALTITEEIGNNGKKRGEGLLLTS